MGARIIDIAGKKFNRWTVIEYVGQYSDREKRAVWKCKCECGNIGIIRGSDLRSGRSKSCGCLQKEMAVEDINNRIDLTGKIFGRLVVLEFSGHDKYKSALWKVKCDCGSVKIVNGNDLRRGFTTSCGCYNMERSIEANSGRNNHNWQGGITPEDVLIRHSFKYRCWRNNILKRDNYTCQMCGRKSKDGMQVHHIYPFVEYAELRFEVWNGVTLCKTPCHESIRGNEYKFIKKFLNITSNNIKAGESQWG